MVQRLVYQPNLLDYHRLSMPVAQTGILHFKLDDDLMFFGE